MVFQQPFIVEPKQNKTYGVWSQVPKQTAKDLGVILDTNLSYEEHITKTVSSWIECLVSVK